MELDKLENQELINYLLNSLVKLNEEKNKLEFKLQEIQYLINSEVLIMNQGKI